MSFTSDVLMTKIPRFNCWIKFFVHINIQAHKRMSKSEFYFQQIFVFVWVIFTIVCIFGSLILWSIEFSIFVLCEWILMKRQEDRYVCQLYIWFKMSRNQWTSSGLQRFSDQNRERGYTCCLQSQQERYSNAARSARHAELNNIIKRALLSADVSALLAPVGLSRNDGKRVEGMTIIPWPRGTDTCTLSNLAFSASRAGRAADDKSQRKSWKYSSLIKNKYSQCRPWVHGARKYSFFSTS